MEWYLPILVEHACVTLEQAMTKTLLLATNSVWVLAVQTCNVHAN